MCVLRALAVDETPKERADRSLDPSLIDPLSWPAYVWEFLALTQDPLGEEEWAHRLPPEKRQALREAAAAAGKAAGGGKKGGAAATAAAVAAAAAAEGAAAGSVAAQGPSRPKSFQPLTAAAAAALDAALTAGAPAPARLPAEVFGGMPVPPPLPTEYYRLPLGLKATILARLCDNLLDCLTIRAEIDRRESSGQLVPRKGGAGGGCPLKTEEER
mgnify:CR=1 FL=1